MSVRIGLYDFFSYTLPGTLNILSIIYFLNAFGLINADIPSEIENITLILLFLLLGAGFVFGLLLDPLSYRWFLLFHKRNREAAKYALNEFHDQHKWIKLNIEPKEAAILLRAVKKKSLEDAMDVEQHNVINIMLRNLSLSFVFISLNCLVYFIVISQYLGNVILAIFFLVLSIIAIRRSALRRHWFYMATYEAFCAHYLFDDKVILNKIGSVVVVKNNVDQDEKESEPNQDRSEKPKVGIVEIHSKGPG